MKAQRTLAEVGGALFDPDSSRFIRTSWMLRVEASLSVPEQAAIVRSITEAEAMRIQEQIRKRHVFSRHSYKGSFYARRAAELANRSVIEVTRPGDPRTMVTLARAVATAIESTAVVSSVLYHSRKRFHTDLGITQHRKDVMDLTLGPGMMHLKASARREAEARGVLVDKRFVTRFGRLRLGSVVTSALSNTATGRRVGQAVAWLLDSRLDAGVPAAVIKCAIALETLLGRSESEPLRRTLSERSAFLLSDDAGTRREVSGLVKNFYDGRSAIVHGATRRRAKAASVDLLEAAERIAFLILITLAANPDTFESDEALPMWVEARKWGGSPGELKRPFRPGDLKRALERGDGP